MVRDPRAADAMEIAIIARGFTAIIFVLGPVKVAATESICFFEGMGAVDLIFLLSRQKFQISVGPILNLLKLSWIASLIFAERSELFLYEASVTDRRGAHVRDLAEPIQLVLDNCHCSRRCHSRRPSILCGKVPWREAEYDRICS